MSTPATTSETGARGQFSAIASVRWQIFVNSLRTMRGRMEMVARVLVGFWFAALGLVGTVALGVSAWFILSHNKTEWLAALLWPVFFFWIFFPLLAAAFAEAFDSSNLLRFPLSYSSFFLVDLIYGSLEASAVVAVLWLVGIEVGVAIAAPRLAPWTGLALAVFGLVNTLLVRAVFAWIERWLARRRTREIMGVLFFLLIVSFQIVGPVMRWLGRQQLELPAAVAQVLAMQKFLPPALTAQAISQAWYGRWWFAVGAASLLAGYGLIFLLLFHLRLRAQYEGENLGEGIARERQSVDKAEARPGWALPGFSGPVTAMMEKEVRYLSRSGPMLFTLMMPAILLLIFRMRANPGRPGALAGNSDLAFPIGAGYALLLLTNLIYNTFGADGAGVQLYFASPVRIRDVLLAKNLVHAGVLTLEMGFVWVATCGLYHAPDPSVVAATAAAVLFAAPLDFCAGNVLSLCTPKKYDYGTFGRQRAPGTTILASFGVQAVIVAVAAITVLVARHLGSLWVATAIFAVLAAGAFAAYHVVLKRVDGIALRRRESLVSELSHAS
jgi:ABC-2 type transport system permease protein